MLACAPGGHDMTSARAVVTPSGRPDATPLADGDDVGLDAEMLDAEHLAGAAHAGLHFVADQQDAVLSASARAAAGGTAARRDDVAALALDRLDDDRRDFVGRDEVHEHLLLDDSPGTRPAQLSGCRPTGQR